MARYSTGIMMAGAALAFALLPAAALAQAGATKAMPRGNPSYWITNADYPVAAGTAEGITSFDLEIGTDGKVTQCTVTESSGSPSLDATVCKMLKRRAQFTPARNAAGEAIVGSWASKFRWVYSPR